MYLYKYGLVVGRFQIFHQGHRDLISKALELCEKVIIYIGSSQEEGTLNNPFSYYVRENMIKAVFESDVANCRIKIRPLPDIGAGNNDIWGRYVLGTFEAEFHRAPDLYITGLEKNRSSWFNNEIAPTTDELRLTRTNINISASKCREFLKNNSKEEWCKFVPEELYDKYDFYREIICKIDGLKPIWVYRFEHTDPKKGAWYNREGHFCCTHPILKQLDMPYEPDVYKGYYRSACANGEDLGYWIPEEAAREMLNQGYIATKYLTTDYFYREHGEICFNGNTYLKKEVVELSEIYGKISIIRD